MPESNQKSTQKHAEPTICLAYGSNLNLEQMAGRCPNSDVVGRTTLRGYDLKFRGDDGRAVATVEPGEGVVPALLWGLSLEDEAALDQYEGYPNFYRKETVTVEMDGKSIDAMMYVMNDVPELGEPDARYFGAIMQGYEEHDFDKEVLYNARHLSIGEAQRDRSLLYGKLYDNLTAFKDEWREMSADELIEMASEIANIQNVFDEFQSMEHSHETVKYLLRFENPLKLASDCCDYYVEGNLTDDLDEHLESYYEELENDEKYALAAAEITEQTPDYASLSDADAHKVLCEKLTENYVEISSEWLVMSRSELVSMVQEIVLTEDIYNALLNTEHTREVTDCLLGLENPLREVETCYTESMCGTELADLDDVLTDMCAEYSSEPEVAPEPEMEM